MNRISSSRARWTLLAALLFVLGTAPAQAQLGITGGLNFESTDDIQNSGGGPNAAFDNSTGYHLGVVYDLGLGPVSVRPGFLYRKVGSYEIQGQDVGSEVTGGNFDVTAYEVPVDLRFTVLPTPVISPYLLAGPQFTFVNGEDEFDDATEDLSFSLNIGAGTDITLPGLPITLQPELRYEFGATTFIKDDFEIGDQTISPEDSPRFSAFSLRLNVLF